MVVKGRQGGWKQALRFTSWHGDQGIEPPLLSHEGSTADMTQQDVGLFLSVPPSQLLEQDCGVSREDQIVRLPSNPNICLTRGCEN